MFTRFDTPTWHDVCFILGAGGPQDGARDRMHLYNSSGRGIWGFHYDPLFVVGCSPGPSPGLRQPRSASAPSSSSSRGGVGELCALFGGARLSAQLRRRTLRRTGSAWPPTPSELRDGGVELLRAVFAGVDITDPEVAVVTAAGCDEGSGGESTSGCGRCLPVPSSGLQLPRAASAPPARSNEGGVDELCASFGGTRASLRQGRRTLRRTGSASPPTPAELRDGGVELLRTVFAGVAIVDPEPPASEAANSDGADGPALPVQHSAKRGAFSGGSLLKRRRGSE